MISIGIFSGYYPYELKKVIKKLKKQGIHSVQLDLKFSDFPELRNKHDIEQNLTKKKANYIRNVFRDNDIEIVAIYGYTNLLAKDKLVREKNIGYLRTLLKYARDLGSPYVVTETGTYSTENDYAYDIQNHTEAAYQDFLSTIKSLVKTAEEANSTLLIEPYVNNVIYNVKMVNRILKDINSSAFGICLDPANFYDQDNLENMDKVLMEIFDQIPRDKVMLAHAKDVRKKKDTSIVVKEADLNVDHTYRGSGDIELPAAGMGVLNYSLYLKLLSIYHPNIPLIMEHLNMEDIPKVMKYLKNILNEVNG